MTTIGTDTKKLSAEEMKARVSKVYELHYAMLDLINDRIRDDRIDRNLAMAAVCDLLTKMTMQYYEVDTLDAAAMLEDDFRAVAAAFIKRSACRSSS